jgi:hypothetical protein
MHVLEMFFKNVNDTSGVVRMTVIGEATTWSIILESRVVICNHNIWVKDLKIHGSSFSPVICKLKLLLI